MTKNNLLFLLLFICAFVYLFISYFPNIYEASVVDLLPQDRQMLWGEHIYTYDYNVYLSKIRQGQEGRWTVVDKFDNNPSQKGVYLQMLYLLSGKFGGTLHLSPTLTFHLLRTVTSFFFVLAIITLNIYFLKKPRLIFLGVVTSLLAASFPVFYRYLDSWWVGQYMGWWTELDPLKRISYIPHYTVNYIIVILFAILISKIRISNFEFRNIRYFLAICFLLFISLFIHPSGGMLFFFSWSLYHGIRTVWGKYKLKDFVQIVIYTFVFFAVAAVPIFYVRSITATYPWKTLIDFDEMSRLPVDLWDYVRALGPVFFTGTLGVILLLIKKREDLLSVATWMIGAFAAILIFKKIPFQAELRFVQTANHIPLAILTIYFLNELQLFLKNRWASFGVPDSAQVGREIRALTGKKRAQNLFKLILINLFIYGIISSILLLGIVQSYFSIKSQTDFIHQRAVAGNPLVPYPPQVMYPLKDFYNAIMWLKNNTKQSDIVFSKITAGNYIPAYSGNFVYLGHNPESPHYSARVDAVNMFFSGTMTKEDALKFLKQEHISYVFYGPQERESINFNPKNYPFLKEIFTSPYVSLHKVI